MIRKLIEEDRQETLEFLKEEAAINLFIIGDIEVFGFSEGFQEIWGDYDEKTNKLQGVLLRYYENYIPYYKDDKVDVSGFKKIIEDDSSKKIISGREEVVERFQDVMKNPLKKSNYFCELKDSKNLREIKEDIKIATEIDAERVYNLLEEIEEFKETDTNSVERIRKNIKEKVGRIYYIENKEGKMVSIAQTTAENTKSAMVVGVATSKGYRGKGLMSQCLSKLCSDLLLEEKSLCLFYSNPDAGRVYHKIGFESIGRWTMLIKGKNQ